jgi:hypothetical protein
VIEIRDHYVAQFRAFALAQRAACRQGTAEVKFQLPPDTTAYQRLAVVDFVRNEGAPEGILFDPDSILTFDRLEGQIDEAQLSIEGLRWDAAIIRHDAPSIEIVIAEWFEKWFDPAEINFDASAELSECIHAVYITRQELQIDFGTATAEAFWELLECLSNSGATSISVSS